MTRIIAGTVGGRTLRTPAGRGTRPTSDRVREALFSALEARGAVAGARVLDLYAGSGALGLEALSRGAEDAIFVESDQRALRTVRANIAQLGFDDRTQVIAMSVLPAVARVGPHPVDLVLVDPPYDLAEADLGDVLGALTDESWLAPGGLVVVERSSRSPAPAWSVEYEVEKPRRYGETTVHLATIP